MNVFVSHAISVGLALLVIAALVLSLNSLGGKWSEFLSDYEPMHLCAALKNSVNAMPLSNSSSSIMGRLFISLPRKSSGADYNILFDNKTIAINRAGKDYTCGIDAPVVLSGSASSGSVVLELRQNLIEIRDVRHGN